MRQGRSPAHVFTTRPSRATKTASIANRMKNMWMLLLGAMTIALPSGRPVAPEQPPVPRR